MRLEDVAGSPHFQEHAEPADPLRFRPGPEAAARLAGAGPRELAALVEDGSAALPDRLAAGGVLALLGDPRITAVPAVCAVPGGTVEIGLPEEDVPSVVGRWAHVGVEREWIEKETPVHRTELADYRITVHPVTNAEYQTFLHDTGHPVRPTTWYLGAYPYDRSNHPVAGVRAADADAYAAWLAVRTGLPWRLPTEAEWEYAAKGPDGLTHPWGDTFDPDAANTRETGLHTTTPVGAFPAGRSPFGALDMGGNVEEYVADSYRPYPGGPYVPDHLVQTMGEYRIARGGSFCRYGDLTRTRRRHGPFPGPLYPVGFRLALSTPPRPHPPTEADA
ncbi:SUMF1/EgtB/PvdO family nonheme iron enzyme [Streptomyces sp. Amel2xC10]|uniref:formylglycine-generating enzyme family protein n=1 Tax=Streptomyces sp. Amel2xC10 TaxID=1305826 RepID=UPI000A083252|nr:SUMF1/EgtB/PvdO family nonheme iron enzyme [Streptomyces sp. Amel2xC10]SMF32131.1 Formylglycine-generating enzyme, required for sulfatase activity, contains SUMF1/FGE domain [Streptomyces sp. Amel2xC10]